MLQCNANIKHITYCLLQNLTITKNEASCGRVLRMIALRLLARSPVRVATMTYLEYQDLTQCLEEEAVDGLLTLAARRIKTLASDAEIFIYPAEAGVIKEVRV